MKRVLEIRNYRLKAGSGAIFHQLVAEQSLPLHREWGMDVVNHGPSLHDPDVYFLMRAYDDLEELNRSQAAFYATEAWRTGPREAIVELIESDANTVFWLSDVAIDALCSGQEKLATLLCANQNNRSDSFGVSPPL